MVVVVKRENLNGSEGGRQRGICEGHKWERQGRCEKMNLYFLAISFLFKLNLQGH